MTDPQSTSDKRRVAADLAGVARAADALTSGRLIAFPTETVYGLGADAGNDDAVARIFEAKGRPHFNPLIVHVADISSARELVDFERRAEILVERFWPGALTLVLKRRPEAPLSRLVSAGLDTAAIRMPRHAVAHQIIEKAGIPVAAPSANRSGFVSPTTAGHVSEAWPMETDMGPDVIVDDGPCDIGLESTVIDLSEPQPTLLRPGGIAVEELTAVLGDGLRTSEHVDAPKSPGMLSRHYAPKTPLAMNVKNARPDGLLLGFGPTVSDADLNLSPSGNLREAAANLFAMLHQLDKRGMAEIAVTPIPDTGLGRAINDRLRRATAE